MQLISTAAKASHHAGNEIKKSERGGVGMENTFLLNGKTALITGSSQGIGKAIAIGMAEAGADIALVARNADKLSAVKEEVEALGRKCLSFKADISNIDEITDVFSKTEAAFGKLDILVNSAGTYNQKPAEDMTPADWDEVLDLNAKSLFFCCQQAGKIMLRNGGGRIINIASTFGVVGFAGRIPYNASKAAVISITQTLALEWSKKGINVNSIAPGPVWTEGRDELFSNPDHYAKATAKLAIGRVAKPKELAGPAVFLASDAASFVTGTTLLVDGGYCAQ